MDPEARRVQAERNRRRLPHQGAASRWARRIVGLLATAALLGSGVAIATMVMPDPGRDSVVEAAPAATPEKAKPTPTPAKKKAKKKGPTKAQLAVRKAAVAEVRSKGYTTLTLGDYDFKATLRVLIARPVGDAAGGYRAFFFLKETFLGNDSLGPSSLLKVSRQRKTSVTLSYGVYATGDTAGQPSGRKRVRFQLEGGGIRALDPIPLDAARFQRRQGA
jgi:hypothetical protein